MAYLLAVAAATLVRAVALAAAIIRATVVRLRLVAQAITGIATSELGPCDYIKCKYRIRGIIYPNGHLTCTLYVFL